MGRAWNTINRISYTITMLEVMEIIETINH